MFRKLPPLHALAAFEAAARHQSFTRAADELFLTHSAVSHRIKQLEQSLDTKLFLRLNRSIVLTPAGTQFLETVRDSLHKLQTASSRLTLDGRFALRVSVAPAFASQWLAHRVGDFQNKHPRIDLEVLSSSQMINLRSGEADVGIRFGRGQWPGYHCVKLFSDELLAVCSPAYLSKIGPIHKPEDLKRGTLLRSSRIPWKEWFLAVGLDWDEPFTGPLFNEVNLLLDAASNGAGIALVGRVVSAAGLRSGRLVRIVDSHVPATNAYFAVCLPEKLKRPEVAIFIEWLAAEASEDLFKGVEAQLRAPDTDLEVLVENLPAGAVYAQGERIFLNMAVEEITGYKRSEIASLDDWFQKLYRHRAAKARRNYEQDRANGTAVVRSGPIFRKDGTQRVVEFSTFAHATGDVWLMNDITERKLAEDRMQRLAYHDHLTELPNRLSFGERLRQSISRARRRGAHVAVLFVDLDGFKQINDELGHDAGDEVLKEVARRLCASTREEDSVARLGGDEFAVLIDDLAQPSLAERTARRIIEQMGAPIVVKTRRRKIGASIGIALYPDDAPAAEDLVKCADVAMYRAKAAGKNKFVYFGGSTRSKRKNVAA